jgi:hypothetical protein
LLPVLAGCRGQHRDSPAGTGMGVPAGAHSGPAATVSVPDFTPGPPAQPTKLADDPVWKEASEADPMNLARLAEREGAAGLLQGVEVGGTLGRTALAALPFADDGELALGRLCQILRHTVPGVSKPVLQAVHALVSRPPEPAELLDPEGYVLCAAVLKELGKRQGVPPATRDLIASARSMLVEHGVKK